MAFVDCERLDPPHGPMVYRDFCNTCGAERGKRHEKRCYLTGEVGAWSGIVDSPAPPRQRLERKDTDG